MIIFCQGISAGGAMAAGLHYFIDTGWWNDWNSTERVLNLVQWIGLGSVIYTATLLFTGLRVKHLTGQKHG